MNLIQNESLHWQITGGAELHSGDQVELYQNGRWFRGEIQYRPRWKYLVRLENGQIFDLNEQLSVRLKILN